MIFDKRNKEEKDLVENKSICRINVIYRKYFESREITCCNKICAIFDIFLILFYDIILSLDDICKKGK